MSEILIIWLTFRGPDKRRRDGWLSLVTNDNNSQQSFQPITTHVVTNRMVAAIFLRPSRLDELERQELQPIITKDINRFSYDIGYTRITDKGHPC
jgi:hypothetical protein